MDEQEVLNGLLIYVKHMKAFFATFSSEASNDKVATAVEEAYNEFSNLQQNAAKLMVEKGYMQVNPQTQSAIDKLYKKYKDKELA